MSTSVSPRSASVHPTRQQLDELDALLQRMLDLPVNQVDEPGPADDADSPAAEYRPPVSYKTPIVEPPALPRLEPRVVSDDEPLKSVAPRAVTPPAPAAPSPPAPPRPRVTPPPAPALTHEPMVPPAAAPAPEPIEPPSAPVLAHEPTAAPRAAAPAPAAAQEPGPDDWVRLASTWQPSAQTWQPLAQSWQQAARTTERPATPPAPPAPEPAAVPVVVPIAAAVIPAPAAPTPAPEPAVVAPGAQDSDVPAEETFRELAAPAETRVAAPARGYAWWQWPFVGVNLAYDVATLPLGPLGAGLRTAAGRNLMAAVGIGSFAAAAALVVADSIGWIW